VFKEGLGMAEQERRGNFWIYVWLGISGLMNLSGMASIADGFVTWAKFFHDIIDVYRATVQQSLAWIGHIIWPFGPLPGWVFDVFVIWAAILLAANIQMYRDGGTTLFQDIYKLFREDGILAAAIGVILLIFLPLLLVLVATGWTAGDREQEIAFRGAMRDILLNFLLLMATFTLLLFINWQIRQHGG
jgi:hypothetical protein